jgi:CheY-like chemotaxis protein/CRISPR/Cas system-associated endoribonuclease Cas2
MSVQKYVQYAKDIPRKHMYGKNPYKEYTSEQAFDKNVELLSEISLPHVRRGLVKQLRSENTPNLSVFLSEIIDEYILAENEVEKGSNPASVEAILKNFLQSIQESEFEALLTEDIIFHTAKEFAESILSKISLQLRRAVHKYGEDTLSLNDYLLPVGVPKEIYSVLENIFCLGEDDIESLLIKFSYQLIYENVPLSVSGLYLHPIDTNADNVVNEASFELHSKPAPSQILIVDDSLTYRTMIKKLLSKKGFSVMTAESGIQAIQKYSRHFFDLILMDVNMPKLDGIETAQLIREVDREYTWHAPVIYVTTRSQEEVPLSSKEGYISKEVITNVINDVRDQYHLVSNLD